EWTSLPDTAEAVHDIQHNLGWNGLYGGKCSDKRIRVRLREAMGAVHIGKVAVSYVLQAARHSCRLVLFHFWHVDDLGKCVGHGPDHERPGVVFSKEIDLYVSVRIVAEQ